ncbi:MAG TPA: protein kinase [Gemmataceae bacterium]|nr:protein kinase [Gemmataceae bacterium]
MSAQDLPSTAKLPTRPPETDLPDPVRSVLTGCPDYANVVELGRGGMGVVYRAHNVLLGRDEVLKVMAPHLASGSDATDRFLREIQAAAQLDHPNIVRAYAARQVNGFIIFSMEYVPGEDLGKVVRGKGPLPVVHACYYARQALLGMQHAHDRGMVHRDIKPANLIRLRRGSRHTIKILDFGLAKIADRGAGPGLTGVGRMLGTPDYIAPEQIVDAQKAGPSADVYSLGCTLYFLLTGRPPFAAGGLYDLLRQHRDEAPTPVDQFRSDLPVGLADVVGRLMEKDPEKRPSASAAAAALGEFLGNGPRSLAARTPPEPPDRTTVKGVENTVGASHSRLGDSARWWNEDNDTAVAISEDGSGPRRRWHLWVMAFGVLLVALSSVLIVGRLGAPSPAEGEDSHVAPLLSPERDAADSHPAVSPETKATPAKADPVATRSPKRVDPVARVMNGNWAVRDGVLSQSDPNVKFAEIFFGDPGWTDVDFSLGVKRTAGDNSVSVLFRVPGAASRPRYQFNVGFYQRHGFEFLMGQGPWHGASTAGGLINGRWYDVTVEVRGSRFRLLIDGRPSLLAEHADLTSGRVGLRTYISAFHFRDIAVRTPAPDRTVLWEGPPKLPE